MGTPRTDISGIDTDVAAGASPAVLAILAALARDADEASPFERLEGQRLTLLSVCALLDSLPGTSHTLVQRVASGLAEYLRIDFPAMIAEEDEILLPLLRSRLLLGDDFDQILRQMDDEHRHDRRQAALLAAECESLANGVVPDEATALFAAFHAFAEQQRRHLAWEDAVVLPLARMRLTETDQRTWSSRIRRRQASA